MAEATIAEGEKYLAKSPDDMGMLLNLRSTVKLSEQLRRQLRTYCDDKNFEVVHYEVPFEKEGVQHLRAREFGAMLMNFQNLLGATTQSIISKQPVDRFDPFPEVAASYLNLGYQTQRDDGTLGFLFLADGEELISNIPVDEAVARVGEMISAKKPEDLVEFSNRFGKSTIRHLHGWVEAHARAAAGLHLNWRHRRHELEFTHEAHVWAKLDQFINDATKSEWVDVEVAGELIGVDLERRWFAIRAKGKKVVTGKFKAGVITAAKRAELPKLYAATLRLRTKTWLATGKTQEAYQLLELKNP